MYTTQEVMCYYFVNLNWDSNEKLGVDTRLTAIAFK